MESHTELVLFGLLLAVAVLAVVARWIRVPYPILLVLGGSALGFAPGMPDVKLDPDLVLLIFLPPLLYSAAFFANLHELRRNVRPIGLLAFGLVLATMGAVAVVAHHAIGLSWAVAFTLGAVVAPTDAVAPITIVRRLGVPRRIITVIEGESLTNDWAALVFYRFAVAAVVTGSFSLAEAGPKFLLTGLGGLAIGLGVGWVIACDPRAPGRPAHRDHDRPADRLRGLPPGGGARVLGRDRRGDGGRLHGLADLPADHPHGSDAGLRGVGDPPVPPQRVPVRADRPAAPERDRRPARAARPASCSATRLWSAAVVIVVRIVWVFAFTATQRRSKPPWRQVAALSWSGMRGGVSLAAALAIPLTVDGGGPFPDRDLVIFLTFAVIVATLVIQGLTLPAVVRALGLEEDGLDTEEELHARVQTARRARERVEELSGEEWVNADTAVRLRGLYEWRHRRFSAQAEGDGAEYDERSAAYQRLQREILAAERRTLLELRNQGRITDEVMRRVERDLDLEESRLET